MLANIETLRDRAEVYVDDPEIRGDYNDHVSITFNHSDFAYEVPFIMCPYCGATEEVPDAFYDKVSPGRMLKKGTYKPCEHVEGRQCACCMRTYRIHIVGHFESWRPLWQREDLRTTISTTTPRISRQQQTLF